MATRKRTARSHRHGPKKTAKSSADAKRRAAKAIRGAARATRAAPRQGAAASRTGKHAIAEAKRATKQAKRRTTGATRPGKQAIARARALVKETERSTRRLVKHGRLRNLPKGIVRKSPKPKPKQHVAKRVGKKLIDALRRKTRRATKRKLFVVKRLRRPAKTPPARRAVTKTRRRARARMRFFSDGQTRRATVTRPTAKKIGRYMGAVGQFLPTGDIEHLAPFEGEVVTDVAGKRYRLETRPNALYELNAEPEGFEEIYELVA
jgi:hypothetical protein